MPFDEISEEIRRNPRPYVALALLAAGVVTVAPDISPDGP